MTGTTRQHAAPAHHQGTGPKKEWKAPEILYREPLEFIASTCIPAPPAKTNEIDCPQGPISS